VWTTGARSGSTTKADWAAHLDCVQHVDGAQHVVALGVDGVLAVDHGVGGGALLAKVHHGVRLEGLRAVKWVGGWVGGWVREGMAKERNEEQRRGFRGRFGGGD
jgi:hypothetical protein